MKRVRANIAGRGAAEVRWEGTRIEEVQLLGPLDPASPYLSCGLIDLQINGYAGIDFSADDMSVDRLLNVLPAIWKTGTTTICATLTTNTIEHLERSFQLLEQARARDARFRATVPCYHLEGPYLSAGEAHGAHDPALMRKPDWDEFSRLQRAAGGNIAIVTLAPELQGAPEFIRKASASGVIVSIGHTDGGPEDVHRAVDAGARMSTHLGNGCANRMDRHKNPLWAQIAEDRLDAGLICDGFHLPADVVRTIYKAKGIGRIFLVTDAIHAAMLPPGRYHAVGTDIDVLENGLVMRADGASLAGSTLRMDRAVQVFRAFTGASLEEALWAAIRNPANLIERQGVPAEIAIGKTANMVLFREGTDALRVERVWLNGEEVFHAPGGQTAIENDESCR